MTPDGLLHSEICGSKPAYGSPQHIAVSCVLLRLSVPRHSPCALCSLTMCYLGSSKNSKIAVFFTFNFSLSFTLLALFSFQSAITSFRLLVGLSGLEPPTSRLSGVRSNRLSYKPMVFYGSIPKPVVEINGIEPLTPCLQSRCSPS